MTTLAGVFGLVLLTLILWDAFEVIILPRRVTRRIRLSRIFYQSTWFVWSRAVRVVRVSRRRERYLSFYGPLSLVFLIIVWAVGMIMAFGMVQWWAGPFQTSFFQSVYMSGTTFITLGLGDVFPHTRPARFVTVVEAGTGFGFLALVISYLPVLYQSFARREANISLLDARAGSPPTAAELLRRYAAGHGLADLDPLLREWELWSAGLLESYISYPPLAYFRSQHDNQSWLAALTTIMDVCTVVIAGIDGLPPWQARLTFAMARHIVVDLAQIINAPPRAPEPDRLPPESVERLKEVLAGAGMVLLHPQAFDQKLVQLRRMYEPYVFALSGRLMVSLSTWLRVSDRPDNWRTSAWERSSASMSRSLFEDGEDVHN
jgi:Ion channel